MGEKSLLKRIRLLVVFFVIALVLSGITAFPLETELKILCSFFDGDVAQGIYMGDCDGLKYWIALVYNALVKMNTEYPFMAYGYDWLAFAHIVISVFFIGVYLKPVRNIWVVHSAMIACVGVLPLAFICGTIRGIPFYWQLIDCSFGVFGMIPLYILHIYIKKLERKVGYTPQKY